MGARAVHGGRPAEADRPGRRPLRRRRRAAAGRPRRVRRRHQRLHRGGAAEPGADARRVRRLRQDRAGLEGHRRHRHRVADRRHLRQGRRARGATRRRRCRRSPSASAASAAARRGCDFRRKEDPEAPVDRRGPALPVPDRRRRSPSAAWRSPTAARSRTSPVAPPVSTTHPRGDALVRLRAGEGRLRAAARLQLGDGQRGRVHQRPPDRRARPAGRLLRPADPGRGGPARRRHRGARRLLPRRQPDRPARPRHRLRVERDDRLHRQRRHVRRGPLPGRLPLPLQGPVPGDGEARALQQLDAERRRRHGGRRRRR